MDQKQFKPFRETYTMITFFMCVGLIYPNPKTDKWRLAGIPLLILSITPVAIMILIDMYESCLRRDILNILRHSTVVGPFLGGFFKQLLLYHKRVEAKKLLDEIDRDYESFNHLPQNYKDYIAGSIKNSLVYCERTWVIIVVTCVMVFPVMAIVLNIYNFTFKSEPVKYMIHDLNRPFAEPEAKFESPYFEILFVYMFYSSLLYVINYSGTDGFYGLSVNHACLKMELYCRALEDALAGELDGMYEKIVNVVKEQNRLFEFFNLIQHTFNNWLGLIFLATMIQICTCMYQITEGLGFDLRYMIFVVGAIIHIYLPCRYAAKLKTMSTETSTQMYCSGWENVHCQRVRKMILFMVARGQTPLIITAFNMIQFDMELFVSMMQTSYSMFTLLRS